jgi:4-amino-4-deoxy-L-arabinose transferase-like glycosyltransferase
LRYASQIARGIGLESSIFPILLAAVVFLGCILSPPSLMDDVDAVQAQIARNMLNSGDWVIARLDGVPYLEKSPLIYWLIAISYKTFGIHDWAARIPVAFAAVLLVWVTSLYGHWAFGERAGHYAGVVLATCLGMFLFTRIQIPDVMLTLAICLAFWAFQRAMDREEPRGKPWSMVLAASLGVGVMLKGFIALVLPVGGVLVYLALTRQLLDRETWRRLHILPGLLVLIAVTAPWHILATLRMPPYWDLTIHGRPGEYHGFLWFYFFNEQVLRFLNLRYPRDYNTVPRPAFWALNLLWLFPWSVYSPLVGRLDFRSASRAARTRLLALCWIGFLLVFFTFSTTQEYYSMPAYPALAMLLGCAMVSDDQWARWSARFLGALSALCAIATAGLLLLVRHGSAIGDIAQALRRHPEAYTLSLGHIGDLTLQSFAYLRLPLSVAGVAFFVGALACWRLRGRLVFLGVALMMVLFIHAAHLALVVFDPYLSSRQLAETLLERPDGGLIINGEYYAFSSVFFYANKTALLWNGRVNNLEYGSYAPGSPAVFIDDNQFQRLWSSNDRYYVLSDADGFAHLQQAAEKGRLFLVRQSGGKTLYTNLPLPPVMQSRRWSTEFQSPMKPRGCSRKPLCSMSTSC